MGLAIPCTVFTGHATSSGGLPPTIVDNSGLCLLDRQRKPRLCMPLHDLQTNDDRSRRFELVHQDTLGGFGPVESWALGVIEAATNRPPP
jgi:hypothetical protein